MSDAKQQDAGGPAAAEELNLDEFSDILEKDFRVAEDEADKLKGLVSNLALAATERAGATTISGNAVRSIKGLIGAIDELLTKQMNEVLHAPEIKEMEGTWRGLHYLVNNTETDQKLKIRVLNISKDELSSTLEDYEGKMFDQSPIYKMLYEQEYSQFGGEPYGALIGAYEFSHHPKDVATLKSMSGICAAAHAPFIAATSPKLFRMESWEELPNPQALDKITSTEDYAAWRGLRMSEDSRYIGLTMPRVLARLPYGEETSPVKGFAYEEDVSGGHAKYTWMNAAFAMGVNINRSHKLYGWGTQIRGVETGGTVTGLPIHTFTQSDGSLGAKIPTEVAIDDRRESELANLGMMPILYRKNSDEAAFIGAMSLQDGDARAGLYKSDPDAAANERLSANMSYLFPVCRFAHYLKAIARDKIGTFKERDEMQAWLSEWINGYKLSNPAMANDEAKAARPLAAAEVVVESTEGRPGYYNAKFFLRPHYQLEGINASLRLVSELPSRKV